MKKSANWKITIGIPWQNERNFSAKSILSQLLTPYPLGSGQSCLWAPLMPYFSLTDPVA
jgi:hypothetical protein